MLACRGEAAGGVSSKICDIRDGLFDSTPRGASVRQKLKKERSSASRVQRTRGSAKTRCKPFVHCFATHCHILVRVDGLRTAVSSGKDNDIIDNKEI